MNKSHQKLAVDLNKKTRALAEIACAFIEEPKEHLKALKAAVTKFQAADRAHADDFVRNATVEQNGKSKGVKAKTQTKTAKPSKPKAVKSKGVSPDEAQVALERIRALYTSRTPESFRRFMDEFVPLIVATPVRPDTALSVAKRHKYEPSLSTLRFQLDTYLGIEKARTDNGDSLWYYAPELRKK